MNKLGAALCLSILISACVLFYMGEIGLGVISLMMLYVTLYALEN